MPVKNNGYKTSFLIVLIVILFAASATAETKDDSIDSSLEVLPQEEPSEVVVENNEEMIRTTFQVYRTALLNQDGRAAWEIIDSHSQQYYTNIVRDCLELEREDLNRLDFITKFTILRLRLEFDEQKLLDFDGRSIFEKAIELGWISKSSVEQVERLHKLTSDGRTAVGYIEQDSDIPVFFFIKEGNNWKFSLWNSFELANQVFLSIAKQNNLSEEELILALLSQVSSYKIDMRIFDGPLI